MPPTTISEFPEEMQGTYSCQVVEPGKEGTEVIVSVTKHSHYADYASMRLASEEPSKPPTPAEPVQNNTFQWPSVSKSPEPKDKEERKKSEAEGGLKNGREKKPKGNKPHGKSPPSSKGPLERRLANRLAPCWERCCSTLGESGLT